MNGTGFSDADEALAVVNAAQAAVQQLRDGQYWKLMPDDALNLGREMEKLSRLVYAAQARATAELHTTGIAASRGCSSTAALLRQAYIISPAEANGRVNAARKTLTRESMTAPSLPPILPALGAAIDAGAVSAEQTKIIVDTMGKLPDHLEQPDVRFWETFLVDKATLLDPKILEK